MSTAADGQPSSEAVHSQPQYAAFLRSDRYGVMGRGALPPMERLRLVLMSIFVAPLRLTLGVGCLFACHVTLRVAELLPGSASSGVIPAAGSFWCRACAMCLGLWVTWERVEGDAPSKAVAAGLISNHGSWADILIHLGHYWCSFAAREGTQDLFLIGYISRKLQCVYVNRLKASSASSAGVSSQIKARMLAAAHAGEDNTDRLMLLFPEGTTTNGKYLLTFKTGAFLAGVPLQPVVIKYDHEAPFSPCWDTIDVGRHFWLLLCQPYTRITCMELPVYVPSEEEKSDPALYAENMRQYMIKYSKLKPSNATFTTKMEYHAKINGEAGTGSAKERAMLVASAQAVTANGGAHHSQ